MSMPDHRFRRQALHVDQPAAPFRVKVRFRYDDHIPAGGEYSGLIFAAG